MTNTINRTKPGKKALLLGGGAPNSPLIAGALAAFYDEGVEFDMISASGAGVLMGLLYTAPRDFNPRAALRQWAESGITDMIYKFFPVNYKVFMKPGVKADAYREAFASFPTGSFFDTFTKGFAGSVWADWQKLMTAAMSPSDLTPQSLGLCAHLQFAERAIDFDAVPRMKPDFYINAYNVTKGEMVIWNKQEITPAHVRASLSFPFIYAPTKIDGDDYIEGAALDPINFLPLIAGNDDAPAPHEDLETLVVLDILGDDRLIRKPRHLYDAWVRSIITPLVKISKSDIRLFELEHNTDPVTGKPKRRLLKADLMGGIPQEHWPDVLDWSQSNMRLLFDVGYKAGLAFCREHAEVLGATADQREPLSEAA
jgi:predicted acylesterase/phospholipase RssA